MNDTEQQRRVLLAEDHPVNQRVAMAMLEYLGFAVDVVSDGTEAVKATSSTTYDAIFMDCQIPGIDGYEATAAIRRLQGASLHTPIIAVTGSAVASDQQRCFTAGMDDYLAKPLTLKAMADVLNRWLPDQPIPPAAVDAAKTVAETEIGHPERVVLDPQVVGRLDRLGKATGQDLFAQLAVLFLSDTGARLVVLRDALARGDAGSVARTAHTLSGAGANLGATDLSRLCATLATRGAAGDLVGGGGLLEEIEGELALVGSALETRSLTP